MTTDYEDVFFYLDISKEVVKKKDIIKAVKYYISEKNKTNLKGHYGLLIFQETGNPIFIAKKKDSEIISNAIEENWKSRPKNQSFFENGLFYIFSFIAEGIRAKSKQNRIIIITDTPSDLSDDYQNALFNLVSKIKNFPTFIDIIRISDLGTRFHKDDVKLNILASDTKGGIFYIHEKKEFMDIIKKLIKSKQLISTFRDEPAKIKIKKEDYDFYSHLAKDLLEAPLDQPAEKCMLCQDEICPVCTDIKDIPRICPSCRSHFHNCCITNHTLQHNIGIPHIFRCPECDILLKINQDEIVFIDDSPQVKVEDYIQHQLTENNSRADFSVPEPPPQIDQDNMGVMSEDTKRTQTVSKTVRIGGFFGKAYSVKKEGDQVIYEKLTGNPNKSTEDDQPEELKVTAHKLEENQQITEKYWKPLSKTSEKDGKPRLLICPACGSPIKEKKPPLHCPYCGSNMN